MIRSPVFLAQPDAGFSPLSFADSLEQPARVQVLTPGPGFSIQCAEEAFFRPAGAGAFFPAGTHGLRRGLHSFAASQLDLRQPARQKNRTAQFSFSL